MISMKVRFDIEHLEYRHNRMRLISYLRELYQAGRTNEINEIMEEVSKAGHNLQIPLQHIKSTQTTKPIDFRPADAAADKLENAVSHSTPNIDRALPSLVKQAQNEVEKIKVRNQRFYNLEWRVRSLVSKADQALQRLKLAINRNTVRTLENPDAIDTGKND